MKDNLADDPYKSKPVLRVFMSVYAGNKTQGQISKNTGIWKGRVSEFLNQLKNEDLIEETDSKSPPIKNFYYAKPSKLFEKTLLPKNKRKKEPKIVTIASSILQDYFEDYLKKVLPIIESRNYESKLQKKGRRKKIVKEIVKLRESVFPKIETLDDLTAHFALFLQYNEEVQKRIKETPALIEAINWYHHSSRDNFRNYIAFH